MKNARAEASNDFRECGLIFFAREAGQFNFGRLFVVGRQEPFLWSAPAERSGDGALDELSILIGATLPFTTAGIRWSAPIQSAVVAALCRAHSKLAYS
jgi:hypothetical protein